MIEQELEIEIKASKFMMFLVNRFVKIKVYIDGQEQPEVSFK